MPTPQKLTGLRPQVYEHPSDKAALDALTHTAGLDTVVRKLNAWGFERLLRVQLTGSYLQVTADSLPEVHDLLKAACDTLNLPNLPDLYIASGGGIQSFTAGVERPLILLYSSTVETLTPEELLFVIAHEVGHIKSGHVLYYQIAEFLPIIGEIVGAATFGVGELLGAGLQIALMRWKRTAELTADRAGLLGCQDADTALRTMMKLAGLPSRYFQAINTEDFMRQAREFKAMDADKLTLLAKWLSTIGEDHPWTVMRAQELLQWIDSGQYETVLQNPQALPPPPPPPQLPGGAARFCIHCGRGLAGNELFCPGCGRSLGQTPQAATR